MIGSFDTTIQVPCKPRVAVVVPAYNAATYLEETINSIMAQEDVDLEVWVIDDGSTDKTSILLNSRSDSVNSLRIENSGGPSRPRNVGVENSRAPFIAFFDADDLMLPQKLSCSIEAISQYPSVGLICSDFCGIDASGQRFKDSWLSEYTSFRKSLVPTNEKDLYLLPADRAYHHLLRTNFIGTSSVICRKNSLSVTGYFDESMKNADDIDMWMRIAGGGWDFLFFDRVMHCYRNSISSISNRGCARFPGMIKGLEKQLVQIEDTADKECVVNRLSELYRMYGYALRKVGDYAAAYRAYSRSLEYRHSLGAYKGLLFAKMGL